MGPLATVGVGLGTLLVGFVIGVVVSRRGRRLRLDWRLSIETDQGTHQLGSGPPPEPPEAPS